GWSVEVAVKLIRGEPGTLVKLNIYREGWSEPKDFEITRQIIEVPTIDWYMVPEEKTDGKRIAYFHLYNFNGNAPQVFFDAVREALFQGAQGVILDLRNNPGGFLEVSTNIAGWFLKRGEVVVTEQFRSGDTRDFRATGNSALADLPVVVLVNAGSASASEIVAGALRDQRSALLIGEKTFGKGTVQEVETLKDGSSIKVSVAQWLTPNGIEINKKGLEPDISIKADSTGSPQADSEEPSSEDAPDLVLEKGIEVLKNKIEVAPRTIILF
ncbi:MAG: S41 family peptidase, partial [Patescibacteria group bacterium]